MIHQRRRGRMTVAATGGLVLLLSAGLAGCASTAENGGGSDVIEGKITMRVYPVSPEGEAADRAFWEGLAADFAEENPGAEVKVEIKPWVDRQTALTTGIAAGTAPDVVYMIPDELAQFQSQDTLAPVTDVIDTSGYFDSTLAAVDYGGELFGAPILMTVVPGLCDAQVLAEAGVDKPPTTWDELEEMAPKFKDKDLFVTQFSVANDGNLNGIYPFAWQAGGGVFDEEGNATIDGPAMVEMAEFLGRLASEGFVNVDQAITNPPFDTSVVGQRKVGCVYNTVPAAVEPFWGEDTIVAPPLTNKEQATYGTVGSLVMLKGSKNQPVAGAWLDYVTQGANLEGVAKMSNTYPPKDSVPVPFAEGSLEAQAAQYLDVASPGALVPRGSEIQSVIAPELQAVVLGKKTAEQAMRDAAAAAEPILAK